MFCTKCGKSVEGSPEFCPHCGTQVGQPQATSSESRKSNKTKYIIIGVVGTILALIAIGVMVRFFANDQSYGKELQFNGGQLFYTSSVTKEEATRLANYLVSQGVFDGNEKTIQINKEGSTYQFRMVIKTGLENDPEYLAICRAFALELSQNVFAGSTVDIHMCDENLKTLRTVIVL